MVTTEALLADLRRVARKNGRATELTYKLAGRYAHTTVLRRFGRWNEALAAAGLPPGRPGRPKGMPRTNNERRRDASRSTPRRCLKCDRRFPSTSAANRICWSCKQTATYQEGDAIAC